MLLALIALTLSPAHADDAPKLSSLLRLPPALAQVYGDTPVQLEPAARLNAHFIPLPGETDIHHLRPANPLNPASLLIVDGASRVDLPTAREILRAVLERIEEKEDQPNSVLSHLESAVLDYATPTLLGRSSAAPQTPLAEAAALWWKLRMVGTAPPTGAPQTGEAIALAIKTYHPSPLRVREHFGHSAIGLRYVGGSPDRDFVLNMGSNQDGHQFVNGVEQNRTVAYNLWDWLQAQRDHAILYTFDVKALRINADQARWLELVREIGTEDFGWGAFNFLTDNCSNAAVDTYDSMLPLGTEFVAEWDWDHMAVTPNAVFANVDTFFPLVSEHDFTAPDFTDDRPNGIVVPAVLPDRTDSAIYREYQKTIGL